MSVFHWGKIPRLQVLANVRASSFPEAGGASLSSGYPMGIFGENHGLEEQFTSAFPLIRHFNPVGKGSIARWLRTLIQEAGVTGGYTAHSVRGAATSAAFLKGMSVLDIIKVADWSSDNTFKTFYYKPISEQKSLLPLLVQQ